MIKLIGEKPWILIIVGFALLITAWTVFFVVALNNQPDPIPLSMAGDCTWT